MASTKTERRIINDASPRERWSEKGQRMMGIGVGGSQKKDDERWELTLVTAYVLKTKKGHTFSKDALLRLAYLERQSSPRRHSR